MCENLPRRSTRPLMESPQTVDQGKILLDLPFIYFFKFLLLCSDGAGVLNDRSAEEHRLKKESLVYVHLFFLCCSHMAPNRYVGPRCSNESGSGYHRRNLHDTGVTMTLLVSFLQVGQIVERNQT